MTAVTITAPGAGTGLAFNLVGGAHYAVGKLAFGDADTATLVTGGAPLPVTGPLSDTELRAAPLDVVIDGQGAPLHVELTSLPLPNGAATETTLAALDGKPLR
jgi:hypothetical protein